MNQHLFPTQFSDLRIIEKYYDVIEMRSKNMKNLYSFAKEHKLSYYFLDLVTKYHNDTNSGYLITENSFPYDNLLKFLPDVTSNILWFKDKNPKQVFDIVESEFIHKYGEECVVWFENPEYMKSVPNIDHVHVLFINSGAVRSEG